MNSQLKNNICHDLSESTKNNFIQQVFFSHRTSHSYNLFNEIKLLKTKSKVTENQSPSFNTLQKRLNASITKTLKTKVIHRLEQNSNEESNFLLTSKLKSNKSKKSGKKGEETKQLKLIYNSLDIKKDNLKQYWTQNNNSFSMNFIQINLEKFNTENSIKKKYKSLNQSKFNLLNNEDLKRELIKEKKFSKLFIKIQNKRNCNSYQKRKPTKTISTNSINIDFSQINNKVKQTVRNSYYSQKIRNKSEIHKDITIQKSRKTNSNNENKNQCQFNKLNRKRKEVFNSNIISNDNNVPNNIKQKQTNYDAEQNDYIFPDDEDEKKVPVSHLPIFAAKKMTSYYLSTITQRRFKKCFSCEQTYNVIIQYLTYKDILCLSLINKNCENRTKQVRYYLIKANIMKQYKQANKQISNKIWNSITHYSKLSLVPFLKKTYLDHAFKQSCYLAEIKKDIIRTYPNDISFKESSHLYKQLLYILNGFANYNEQIGYAQGINFILAKIIPRSKSDEEALLFLDSIMNKLHMETVIGISNQLVSKMNEIGELIKKSNPSFVLFLKEHNLSHELFTANWVITLFSNTLDTDELYIVWDFIIVFGWKFVHCFIIAIINTFQKSIVSLNFATYSEEIKKFLCNQQFKQQFAIIIELSFELFYKL